MTKEEFKNLDPLEKINYINSKLEAGQTVIRIREDLGIGEKALQKIIKDACYKYNAKYRRYVATTQTTTKSTTNDFKVEVVETNTNALLTTEKANTLDYLSNNIDVLMDMIDKYKATTKATTNYITIDLVDDKHLKPKPKSIRINEFIYQEWQEFCDKQHYSKMDLISMALKEYMEKYK